MTADHEHDWVEKEIKRIKCRACRICRVVQIKTKAFPDGKRWTYSVLQGMSQHEMDKWAKDILGETITIRCYKCGRNVKITQHAGCETVDCLNCGTDIRAVEIVEQK